MLRRDPRLTPWREGCAPVLAQHSTAWTEAYEAARRRNRVARLLSSDSAAALAELHATATQVGSHIALHSILCNRHHPCNATQVGSHIALRGILCNRQHPCNATQVGSHIALRGILCNRHHPCNVTLLNASSTSPQLRICLPRIAAESLLCEPWGEKWQRIGAPLPPCISLDVRAVASWYSELRSAPPFLAEDDPQLERTLAAKRRQRAQQQHSSADDDSEQVNGHNAESFRALLHASSRHERRHHRGSQVEWNRPGRFASCALVGSGHDLQCGTREMGSFIDSHDRVFRSNGAHMLTYLLTHSLTYLQLHSITPSALWAR